MTIADIQNLIKSDETRTLELKKTTGELQDGMHSACAMLNSDGGYLIFGITPNSHKIIGQQVTDSTRQEIANALTGFEPAIDIVPEYIDVTECPGNKLIVFHLNPWKYGEEPYVYHGCPYYKPESITKIMPREMYDERIKAANPLKFEWDLKPAYEVDINDLDEERIRGVVRAGVRGNRLHASADSASVEMLLQKLNLLTKEGIPTNAAAMLFAKNSRYPQFLLRMCRFRGITKDVFIDPKEVYGNFFDILDAAIEFCFKHLFLTGEIVGLQRVETLEIPYEALREAIINALCHRDYEQPYASASLAIYDDRVEITNPGKLPVELTPETIFLPHGSFPHNPLIAQVLYQTTYLDKWGSGVERIVELCKKVNVPTPIYSVSKNEVMLTFPRPQKQQFEDGDSVKFSVSGPQVGSKLAVSWQQVGSKLAARQNLTIKQIAQHMLKYTVPSSAKDICHDFGFKDVYKFRRDYITPLVDGGMFAMTIPDKPTSSNQRYVLTEEGHVFLNNQN